MNFRYWPGLTQWPVLKFVMAGFNQPARRPSTPWSSEVIEDEPRCSAYNRSQKTGHPKGDEAEFIKSGVNK
jgi:hypothetical protein